MLSIYARILNFFFKKINYNLNLYLIDYLIHFRLAFCLKDWKPCKM